MLSALNVDGDCDEGDDGDDGDGGGDDDGVGDKGLWKRSLRMEGWWQGGACLGHQQPLAGHRK